MQQALAACTYRRARMGSLVCTIASRNGRDTTDTTSAKVCRNCSVPSVLEEVNCANLSVGKTLSAYIGGLSDYGVAFDCEPVGFDSGNDYKVKCRVVCDSRVLMHALIQSEPTIRVDGATSEMTDQQLRQAVLLILYRYHARHPERYGRFDVTPAYLAKCLDLPLGAIVRVVGPMDERGEVKILSRAGDQQFSFVAITSKGIEHIDSEPLFTNTAGVRTMGDSINITNSTGVAVTTGDQNTVTLTLTDQRRDDALSIMTAIQQGLRALDLGQDEKAGALVQADMAREEIARKEPRSNRIVSCLVAIKAIVVGIAGTAAAAPALIEDVNKVLHVFAPLP